MVPFPGTESISTVPPASVMIPWTVASPSPVPSPASFVVKKGSKARSRTSAGMPVPSSLTVRRTPASVPETPMESVPPAGIASRALTARLTRTCSSCATVGQHRHEVGADARSAARSARQRARSSSRSRSRDEDADVEDLGLDDLPPAEHQELARERGGPVGGAADLVDVVADVRVGASSRWANPTQVEDHGEQVVEVVRDAARELPDALQALGLREALLELLARPGGARSVRSVAIVQTA